MNYHHCIEKNRLLRDIKTQRILMSRLQPHSKNWWLKLLLIKSYINEYKQLKEV
jgi:hypothetical protein